MEQSPSDIPYTQFVMQILVWRNTTRVSPGQLNRDVEFPTCLIHASGLKLSVNCQVTRYPPTIYIIIQIALSSLLKFYKTIRFNTFP